MKTRINQQYKVRKEIKSVTLNIDIIAESVALDDEKNFSRYVGKALKHYNEYIKKHINPKLQAQASIINAIRKVVVNMMIEWDELGIEITTTSMLSNKKSKEKYFAEIKSILSGER